jgi:hypothetical protein
MESSIMKKSINEAAGTVTFTFEGLAPVVLDTAQVTQANRDYAMLFGFASRIGDKAAITKGPDNGYKVTEAMRREAVLELVEHYQSATVEWEIRAKARATLNPHIQAIANKRGCSYAEAQAWFTEKLMAELAAE